MSEGGASGGDDGGREVTDLVQQLRAELARLAEQIDRLPPPLDDAPVQALIGNVLTQVDALHHQVTLLPQIEFAEAVSDGLLQLITRIEDLGPPDLQPVHAAFVATASRLDAIARQVDALPGSMPVPDDVEARRSIDALAAQVDALRTSLADRFDAIPAPDTDHVSDRLDALVTELAGLPRHDLAPLRLSLGTVADHLATMRAAVEQLPTAASLADLRAADAETRADLALVTEVLGALTELVQVDGARLEQQLASVADAHGLGLAQVTTSTDALTTAIGGIRSAITDQVAPIGGRLDGLSAQVALVASQTTALDGTTAALADQVLAELQQLAEEVHERRGDGGRLDAGIGDLATEVGRLGLSVAAVGRRVDELPRLLAALGDRLRAIERQEEARPTVDVAPLEAGLEAANRQGEQAAERDAAMAAALDALTARVASTPPPDLGPVAAQLARLVAGVGEQERADRATTEDVEDLRRSLLGPLEDVVQAQARLAAVQQATVDRLGSVPTAAEQRADLLALGDRVAERLGSVEASVGRLSVQLAELGSIPRRRRRAEEPVPANPVAGPALALVAQVERDLQAVNGRLAALADRVERAAIAAEDAADVAAAAMRAATPPPPTARARATKAEKPATKNAAAKKTAAKKSVSKKAAGATKKAATKKATTPGRKATRSRPS